MGVLGKYSTRIADRPSKATAVQVSIHDRSQIEVSFDYRPSCSVDFQSDFYFFLPKNLGINSHSYSTDQFYNDLINYLRFHTPQLDASAEAKHFPFLVRALGEGTTQARERWTSLSIQEVKLFANWLNMLLKGAYRTLSSGGDERIGVSGIFEFAKRLREYRSKFVASAGAPNLKIGEELRAAIVHADEFLSNRLVATCADLLQRGMGDGLVLEALGELLVAEKIYRRNSPTGFLEVGRDPREHEQFYFRHSLLKKDVSNPLYIERKSSKQEKTYRNWVAGLGAGLAGLWAQVADYQTRQYGGQRDFGLSVLGVGLAAVVIYIFKDRIKDLSKEYINDKLKFLLPDFRASLLFREATENTNGKGTISKKIGSVAEFVKFSALEDVPEEVAFLRQWKGNGRTGLASDGEGRFGLFSSRDETVLHYHKSVKVDGQQRVLGVRDSLCDMKDIHRFSFRTFLDHLDDAKKQISVFDEDDGAARISAPKVYHVNLIIRTRTLDSTQLTHARIILDKDGVVRLEPVLTGLELFEDKISKGGAL